MKFLMITLTMLVSTSVFAMTKDCEDKANYKVVSLAEMQKLSTNPKVTIIDVNSAKSYKKEKIGKAIHFGSNKTTLAKLLPKDKGAPIVAYCGGVKCGAWKDAAVVACKAGYTNIRHFPDGITGWEAPKKI